MINPTIEEHTKSIIFKDLAQGDPNFDLPHTQTVVHHIKNIIKANPELDLDPEVLIISAYAHDWGYSPFYRKGSSLSFHDYMEAKKKHMDIGAQFTSKLLQDNVYSSLTDQQKERILHLVRVHDRYKELTDVDELILMEADSLGGMDVSKAKPTFDPVSNKKFMENSRKERLSRFITEYSKSLYEKLYREREEYYLENAGIGRQL